KKSFLLCHTFLLFLYAFHPIKYPTFFLTGNPHAASIRDRLRRLCKEGESCVRIAFGDTSSKKPTRSLSHRGVGLSPRSIQIPHLRRREEAVVDTDFIDHT